MAGKDMTLRMVLKLAANDFTRGISAIQKQLQGLGNYFKTVFAVGSVVSFGREMVKWTKEYEDAMARAKAVSNATTGELKMMNDEALRLGATTRYTSVQVAQTLEVLTRNGLTASNATKILADVLKLAQANAIELADAGNMVTNVLNMFQLGVSKSEYVIDKLSYTASHSATDITSLYEAMTNAAPMAHALGIGLNQVSAALGALANVGVKGPDAGTQLRQFLQRLTDPLAMKKMQKLTGFSFDEDFIKTENLEGVLKKLQSMALSVSQLNEIFTVRSSKSIIQLLNSMENFESLLKGIGEETATATRMFNEGVGSMRYELDILRSMWQNWMIEIGNSTKGPFLTVVRFLQDFIKSLQHWETALMQIIPVMLIFRNRVKGFYTSMIAGAKAWAAQSVTATKIQLAEKKKAFAEEVLMHNYISAATKKRANAIITSQKKLIASYQAEMKAANALKATLASIGWGIAIVAVETLVTKIAAYVSETKSMNEAMKETRDELNKTRVEVGILASMIGDGENEGTLNSAVKKAKDLFPDFANAIEQARIAAGKTKEYEKLKQLLYDIYNLQSKIAQKDAQARIAQANAEKLGKNFYSATTFLGTEQRYSPFLREFAKVLEKKGLGKDDIKAAMNDLAAVMISESANTDNQIKSVKGLLDGYGFEKTNDEITKFINDVGRGEFRRFRTSDENSNEPWYSGGGYDNGYRAGSAAAQDAALYAAQAEGMQSDINWQGAYDKFLADAKKLEEQYANDSKGLKDAMSSLVTSFENSVKELTLGDNEKKILAELRKQYPALTNSYTSGGSGSGSKKKTTQDKFNDVVQDYVDELKKLDEQLKNGTVTQEHYDKAVSDAKVAAVEAVSGFEDLDTRLKNLPDNLKIAGDELVSLFQEYGKLMAENIILGFREKAKELENEYENGPKDEKSTKSYNEALNQLAADTMEELMKIQDLYRIYDQLDARVRALWDYINERKGNNDAADADKQRKALDKDTRIEVKKPEVQVILSPDDNSVDGMIQQVQRMMDKENFELNIQIENDTSTLDVTKDKIKDVEKAIETVQDKLENGDYDLVKDEALKRLEDLKKYLVELMKQSTSLEDKLKLSKLITKLNTDITGLSEKTLDNISSMASAFDRLKDSVKDIAEAFDVEIEMEGLEKGITVINAIIQAIESVKEVMEVFDSFQELSNKKKVKQNAEVAISNMAVAASESSKSVAAMEGTMTNVVESASATAAAAANKKQAASNYNVAASEATKAAASGTAAVAQGAESVSKTPYVGAILAIIAAGAIAAALIAAFSKVKGFANGGIVGGNSFYGDKNLIRANSGEMVLTRGDQRTLFKAIKTGNFGGGGNVEFVIRGEQLVGTLNNYKRIHR